MMEKERCCDEEKAGDDVVLPGFRFHPTDEELVGFYLKRKIMQKPLSIELIRQLDIYKYDPWDLPKLATTGEKDWYFYCPRDRKYRNSVRPNRVTSAGFWKATGTDRPIYSSEGGKCIGLKKSLVFYRGRAAKGIKTDWMMHEFRLPSTTDIKRPLDKNIPPDDPWAICRIFKKTSPMAQRALSHSWAAQLPEPAASEMFSTSSNTTISVQASAGCTAQVNGVSCTDLPSSFYFSPATDMASILMNMPPPLVLGDLIGKASADIEFSQRGSCTTVGFPEEITKSTGASQSGDSRYWLVNPSYDLMPNRSEAWTASSQWESMPCPSEMSASYMAKCYT